MKCKGITSQNLTDKYYGYTSQEEIMLYFYLSRGNNYMYIIVDLNQNVPTRICLCSILNYLTPENVNLHVHVLGQLAL